MPRCSQCQKWILGGIRHQELRFCDKTCREDYLLDQLAEKIGDAVLSRMVQIAHHQPCPTCQGPGPVDYYTRHTATSLILFCS